MGRNSVRLKTLVVMLCVTCLAAAKPAFAPMDVFALEWVDEPVIAPDGLSVIYQHNGFDVLKDQARSQLWRFDFKSNAKQPLPGNTVGASNMVFAPDGKRIAFVQDTEAGPEIVLYWLGDGSRLVLTQLDKAPRALSFSPDGGQIAFISNVAAEPAQFTVNMPKAPKGAQWAAAPQIIEDVLYRADGAGYTESGFSHVFVVGVEGGAARQVSSGKHDFEGAPVWLPDGESLIVSANLADDADRQPFGADLYQINLGDGQSTQLTGSKGPENGAQLSPDGKFLAYTGYLDQKLSYQQSELMLLDLSSGHASSLTASIDVDVAKLRWADAKTIYVQYDQDGKTWLGRVAKGGASKASLSEAGLSNHGWSFQALTSDLGGTSPGRPYTSGTFDARAGRVVYTQADASKLADLAVLEKGASKTLTQLNQQLLPQRELGRVEEIRYPSSADGRLIHAWIIYPPGFDPKQKYPMLLEIHGGPHTAYGPHFAPELQLYATLGYVVLYTNPRGSTSYGQEFAQLIHHNYPSQDYDDLMSGVDAVLAKAALANGFIDEQRLFVTGGSGGGVLTAWIVGHTERFRAAVVAKPVINWMSFALTADAYPYFTQYWFPAPPWEMPEHYLKHSPLMMVGKVTTPTMVIVGDADYRTPVSESEQYFQALQMRKVPTMLIRLPGASHAINRRPSQLVAQILHSSAWFERHSK